MNTTELAARYEWAVTIAREAGRYTLQFFQQADLAIEIKSDASPVTVADRQAEQLLRQRIAERFPQDAILGEEFGEQRGTSGYRWILDPIDGTKSFVHGVPLYGTLVAVEHGERSVIGVNYLPALDEGIHAAAGQGAWHHRGTQPKQRARVSQTPTLKESLVLSSEVRFPTPARQQVLLDLAAASRINRTWGDCYGYLLVATGRAEVMLDPIMGLWDIAPMQPILEEAGGTLTDWKGNSTIYSAEAVATNGKVLPEVLEIVKRG
jgi:histidinol phosphatase-like enzyme (inositol monophosphatase family)